ncbi:hypothetical protein FOA52_010160 [Chlamydomonas sp. UWO 241]|nr:hypothetical protein FOA52_010160 [Chlamydomonas sp. UWO 241]
MRAHMVCAARGKAGSGSGSGSDSTGAPEPTELMHVVEAPAFGKPRPPLQRSAFRRKGPSTEEWKVQREAERAENTRRQTLLEEDFEALRASPVAPRVRRTLLVDAYNVMNIDAGLQASMRQYGEHGLGFARAELEQRTQKYAAACGCKAILVYDAMGNSGRSSYFGSGGGGDHHRPAVTALDSRVSVVYSSRAEADSYIVAAAQALKKAGALKVEIVSNDRRVQMECSDLDDWVIYPLDATQFMSDLAACARGDLAAVEGARHAAHARRGDNAAMLLEVAAAARAAAAARGGTPVLPQVEADEMSLLAKLQAAAGRFLSDDDEGFDLAECLAGLGGAYGSSSSSGSDSSSDKASGGSVGEAGTGKGAAAAAAATVAGGDIDAAAAADISDLSAGLNDLFAAPPPGEKRRRRRV